MEIKMNINTNNLLNKNGPNLAAYFLNLLEKKGMSYEVSWFWCGRSRDGKIKVFDAKDMKVLEVIYARNTALWYHVSDENVRGLRRNSAKYFAVKKLISSILKFPDL
jgi:effector-binding domain-containing protein